MKNCAKCGRPSGLVVSDGDLCLRCTTQGDRPTAKQEIEGMLAQAAAIWRTYRGWRRDKKIDLENIERMAEALKDLIGTCGALVNLSDDLFLPECGYQFHGQAAGGIPVSFDICHVHRPCPEHKEWYVKPFCTEEIGIYSCQSEIEPDHEGKGRPASHGRYCMLKAERLGVQEASGTHYSRYMSG